MDFGIISLFFSFLLIHNANTMEFIENDYQSGLVFQKISDARITYDSFALVYHADLETYFEMKETILECYEGLKRFCKFQGGYCDISFMTIDRRLAKMDKNEADVNLYQSKTQMRRKRSPLFLLAAGGTFIGLINSLQAAIYGKEIRNLKADHSLLTRIQHDGLVFLKENIVTSRNATLYLKGVTQILLSDFNQMHLQEIKSHTRETRYFFITRMEQLINLWFMEHESVSELILNHLHSAMYGRFSHLIPVKLFSNDLVEIERLLSDQQKLPINIHAENPLNIFKFATTRAAIYDSKLLIEITIPKMDRELYTLFKIIPIPIHSNGFMNIIIPAMDHVLIDQSTANFIPITNEEFENAPSNTNGEKIISPNSNIFHDFRDNCEMSLKLNFHTNDIREQCNVRTIPISNYFISMGSYNKYFISLSKPTTLIEFCPRKPILSNRITSSGFLTLSEDCKIQTDKITLRPRIKTIFEDHTEIKLFANLSKITFDALAEKLQNVSDPTDLHSSESSVLIDNYIENFDDLANRADQVIDQISDRHTFNEIYQSKIKHNFFIVVGILSVLLLIITFIGYYLHSKFYNIKTWVNLASRFSNAQTSKPIDNPQEERV